jgi:O-antigen/teichoic acid export membrane protein
MTGRKAILAFSVSFLKNVIGYVAIYIIVRKMGPEAFGTLCFGFAYVGIFNFIADMGIGSAHIKKLTEGRDVATCMGTYLVMRLIMTVVMASAVLASILLYRWWFGRPFQSAEHEQVIFLALATFAFIDIGGVAGCTFIARKETAKQVLPDLIGKTVETGLKIAIALAGLGVVLLAGASMIGAAIGLLLYALLSRGVPVGRPTRRMGKDYALFAVPLLAIQCAQAVTDNFDQIMIQLFWNSEELGFYGGAVKITTIISWAGVALGTLIFPTVSVLHGNHDMDGIKRVTYRAERFAAMALFPVGCLIMFFNAETVRLLLGGRFERANPVVMALVWSSVINVLTAPYAAQIIGVGRVKLYGALGVASTVFCVVLNLILIPRQFKGIPLFGLGAMGAALASVTTAAFMSGFYRYAAYRVTGTRFNPSLIRHGLASLFMLLSMAGFTWLFGRTMITNAGAALTGAVVYAGMLVMMGESLKDDLFYLLKSLSPGEMGLYIRNEFRPSLTPTEDQA